jgi:hypothetical protein
VRQVTDENDPPRLSDALIAAGNRLFALENVWHESHPRPSRLLTDPVGTIGVLDEDAGQTVTIILAPSPQNMSESHLHCGLGGFSRFWVLFCMCFRAGRSLWPNDVYRQRYNGGNQHVTNT